VKKEQSVIDSVKTHVADLVDPKEPEVKAKGKVEVDKVKKFMDDASKQAEKEEARKEELAGDPPAPNSAIKTVDAASKSAGDAMEAKIGEQVKERQDALDTAVKKQESNAARAHAKSLQPVQPDSTDAQHNSADEKWTANMPDTSISGFIQKKVATVVKK